MTMGQNMSVYNNCQSIYWQTAIFVRRSHKASPMTEATAGGIEYP